MAWKNSGPRIELDSAALSDDKLLVRDASPLPRLYTHGSGRVDRDRVVPDVLRTEGCLRICFLQSTLGGNLLANQRRVPGAPLSVVNNPVVNGGPAFNPKTPFRFETPTHSWGGVGAPL
jgi:hypothetical protein